jgi:hypothetical protein
VFEVKDKYNVYLITMATIAIPDVPTAINLQLLPDEAVKGYAVNGIIKRLIPESGPYRNFPYDETLAETTCNGATVTTFDARAAGRTVSAAVVDSMLTTAWLSLY